MTTHTDDEQNECPGRPFSHPGDPAEDNEHDFKSLGEADGTTFLKCRKCGEVIER